MESLVRTGIHGCQVFILYVLYSVNMAFYEMLAYNTVPGKCPLCLQKDTSYHQSLIRDSWEATKTLSIQSFCCLQCVQFMFETEKFNVRLNFVLQRRSTLQHWYILFTDNIPFRSILCFTHYRYLHLETLIKGIASYSKTKEKQYTVQRATCLTLPPTHSAIEQEQP